MIAIGCDHGGFQLKGSIVKYLKENNIEFTDVGAFDENSVDYPDIAKLVCKKILDKECDKGILICGTGIGISISANKFNGIRAALCSDTFSAEFTRKHNDANVLCMGGRVTGPGLAVKITETFLNNEFEGGRHMRRLEKIAEIEKEN